MARPPSALSEGQGSESEGVSGPPVVVRFSATERAFHWGVALPTLVLLVTGLFLRFGWLQSLMVGYDRRVGLRLHLVAGLAFLFAPLLVILLGSRRPLAEAGRTLLRMERGDLRFLRDLPRWLRNDPEAGGEVGRFNGGQKVNALVSGITLFIATATGVFLWVFPPLPEAATGAIPALTFWVAIVHEATTYILLPVLLGHIFMALVHPRTRESLRGILFGFVDAEWARRHHPRWYREVEGAVRPQALPAAVQRASQTPAGLPRLGP
jgi:formate dehydrogenase subunit gamma